MTNIFEKLIGKSWRTTLIGLIIIVAMAAELLGFIDITAHKIDNMERFIGLLVAAGFMFGKDGKASHSKDLQKSNQELQAEINEIKKKLQ